MDPPEIVTLMQAPTAVEAKVVASVLWNAGIPCYVDSEFLQDEFAISQMVIGGQGSTIQVPRALLEEARAVLREARAAGAQLSELEGDSSTTAIERESGE